MYNPYPYDDPRAINKPVLAPQTIESVTAGTPQAAARLAREFAETLKATPQRNLIVAFDGYTTADWTRTINLLSQQLGLLGIGFEAMDFARVYKTEEQIHEMVDPYLEWDRTKDPTLLYGRIFRGGYEAMFDPAKIEGFARRLSELQASADHGKVIAVYGYGCLVERLRPLYDRKCYFDVTPKESILRIRRGEYANLGDRTARPANLVIRRCYYVDFEMAVHLRGELLQQSVLDYYVASDHHDRIHLLPRNAMEQMLGALAAYPFRCKPVYLEGVWGGTYVKKLRNLPDAMRNCAWVFDLIPMEVSIVVEAGAERVEFPFFTFVQREGEAIMGDACVKKFHGYFPIRFNYDDSYHSNGNMSIQVHSGARYNQENYDELGRQDESYYVVVAGHNARTFVGFRDDADTEQFIRDIKRADTEYKPVDYLKYVNYEVSKPGLQVMLPAGTIHSSGRNQVVLEIGSRCMKLKDESEWFKIPDHHQAIVSKELFEKANASIKRFSLPNKKQRDYLLRGKVFCGCCDHAMSLRNDVWFYCRHSEVAENLPCHGVRVKMVDLEQAVFEIIRAQMCPALGIDSSKDKLDLQTVQQAEHEDKLHSIQDSKRQLYEQYALGEIDLETYQERKAVYDAELVQAKNVHAAITAQTKQIQSDYEARLKQREIVQEVDSAGTLTQALIDRLINKVYIFPGDRIEIEYVTQDFLATAESGKEA